MAMQKGLPMVALIFIICMVKLPCFLLNYFAGLSFN